MDNQPNQPFGTPGEALAHYGIKGMKWGVRNEDRGSGEGGGGSRKSASGDAGDDDAVLAEYKAAAAAQPTLKGKAALRNMQANQEKSRAKLEDGGPELGDSPKELKRTAKADRLDALANEFDARVQSKTAELDATAPGFKTLYKRRLLEADIVDNTVARDQLRDDAARVREGKLTSGQKKALVAAGLGAAVVGTVLYSKHKNATAMRDLEAKVAAGDSDAKLKLYNIHLRQAKTKTWMFGGYVQKESWDREEFELPAGHTFHRLSTRDESSHGYRPGTYSTPSEADFNRYVAGFRREKGGSDFYHVTFQSKSPTKVPDLKTTVETLRETMERDTYGINPTTRAQALAEYQRLSGGSWNSSLAGKFFSNLQAKGYGAIVDEMDAGVIGDRPLVFFNTQDANRKESRLLDSGEITNREKSIKILTKPPRKG